MALRIQVNPTQTAVTVHLGGSLDNSTSPDLQKQIDPILESGSSDLVFDLAHLDFVSSAGLRVFFVARKRLAEANHETSFVNLQPHIQEVFEIVKALPGVNIFSNAAEMDSYLASRQNRKLHGDAGTSTPPSYNIDLD